MTWPLRLIARPWIDPLCLWGLRRLLPASRAWAAAGLAEGDLEKFTHLLRLEKRPDSLAAILAKTATLRRAHEAMQARWDDILFDGGESTAIAKAEGERRRAAGAYLGQRFRYWRFARRHRLAIADFAIPEAKAALRQWAPVIEAPDPWFATPDLTPEIAISGSLDRGSWREYWLRFRSPGEIKDIVWVRVLEGKTKNPPTLIFGHGLAMETEMIMASDPRALGDLAASGLRILLPDAPGHNRRVVAGLYGGESFLRAGPVSGLDHFRRAAREFAALTLWCRAQGSGRIAWGGISLGALTAQVGATRSLAFPGEARPDALLLLTTSAAVAGLASQSAIAELGLTQAIQDKGWSPEDCGKLAPITDALVPPPIDPRRIILLLGRRDRVTPYAGGEALAKAWRLPAETCFRRDLGHFSAALALGLDLAPFAALNAALLA